MSKTFDSSLICHIELSPKQALLHRRNADFRSLLYTSDAKWSKVLVTITFARDLWQSCLHFLAEQN